MCVSCAKNLLVKFDPVKMLPSKHGGVAYMQQMDSVGVNYMAQCRSISIRKPYQIKTIDTSVHTVESPCMLYM